MLQESDGYVSWVVVISEVGTELYLLQCELHLKKNKTKLQKALWANPGSEGPTSAQVGVLGHLE